MLHYVKCNCYNVPKKTKVRRRVKATLFKTKRVSENGEIRNELGKSNAK